VPYCSKCGSKVADDDLICSACGVSSIATPNQTGTPAASQNNTKQNMARSIGRWVGRHPILAALLFVLFFALLWRSLLNEQREPITRAPSGVSSKTQAPEINFPKAPPLKFRVFRFKIDVPTSYVVPLKTSDEEIKNLLWFFRRSVRAGDFKSIGITQPTTKQWGKLGYTSGMLDVFRGEKCANEEHISDEQMAKGNFGPCGRGEHDDALYQWGIDGDSYKDAAGIRTKNGGYVQIFDYKDDWHAPSESLQRVDQKMKSEWQATQQEWEPRQRFAVQMTNRLNKEGIDVHASANESNPKQLDFRAPFKNGASREMFINKVLPEMRQDLCNVGFRSIVILQESGSDVGQSYPLQCQQRAEILHAQ